MKLVTTRDLNAGDLFLMGSDRLSSLPPELICKILGQLDSTHDLSSIIRASPSIYTGAFTDSRELVLRHVAENAFKSIALSIALTAVRFLKANTSLKESHTNQKREDHKESFVLLVQLLEKAKTEQQRGPTLAENVALCGLLSSFNAFAQHCGRQFLATAKWELAHKSETVVPQNVSLSQVQGPISLSDTELGRLQRGYLRYITLQSLIHPIPPDRNGSLSSQDIQSLLANFTPWEVEEIACIHQYTVHWLRRILDEVEDDFVESVITAKGPSRWRFLPNGEDKRASFSSLEAEFPFVVNSEDELGPDGATWQESDSTEGSSTIMFLKSEKGSQPDLIEHLATLPPKCFRTLVESTNPQRRSIINRNYYRRRASLEEAMQLGISSERRQYLFQAEHQGRQRREKLRFEGDDLRKRNLAWLWAHPMISYPGYDYTCDTDLRAWGYVFWDKDRLEQMRLLEKPRPSRFFPSLPPYYLKPESRPSAQERLRNLGFA